jgi:hypothetical protein
LFLTRGPYGYHDVKAIDSDLRKAGFTEISIETVKMPCRGGSPLDLATGYCQGSPLGREIEARKPGGLATATDAIVAALVDHFGSGPLDTTMQAHVITTTKR